MKPVLEVNQVSVEFKNRTGATRAVNQVSFYVEKGESLGILGESGSGKSVTSLSIIRLLSDTGHVVEGDIQFHGNSLLQLSDAEMRNIRGNKVAMIFQEPMTSLNPVLTIGRQLSEVLRLHRGFSKTQAREASIELLGVVGISRASDIVESYPHQLSGGMRQRVMIAMAIACNPELLIADEPTTALDVTIQAQILDLLRKLRQEMGMSLLLITHDLGVVAEMCDRVLIMYAGEVVETADVRSILRHPKHPYTQGLIKSTPKKGQGHQRLYSIPGQVPSPGQVTVGCKFASRCEHVMPICMQQAPSLVELAPFHQCACWLHQGSHTEAEATT